jgi:hypothetical protein
MRAAKHGGQVSGSESRARLMLSSCSTDQFYNYSTKVNLRETAITDISGPSVPFVVMRHVSFAATETEGGESGDADDVRTLASEPGAINMNAFPILSLGRRAGSCGRLADVNASEMWKMRGRRMAIDMGAYQNDEPEADIFDSVAWRRGRRMAIDLSAVCDEVIVDVEEIVGTGGITEAYTTDTGSEDSVTASLQPSTSAVSTKPTCSTVASTTTAILREFDGTSKPLFTQDECSLVHSGNNGHVTIERNHVCNDQYAALS